MQVYQVEFLVLDNRNELCQIKQKNEFITKQEAHSISRSVQRGVTLEPEDRRSKLRIRAGHGERTPRALLLDTVAVAFAPDTTVLGRGHRREPLGVGIPTFPGVNPVLAPFSCRQPQTQNLTWVYLTGGAEFTSGILHPHCEGSWEREHLVDSLLPEAL